MVPVFRGASGGKIGNAIRLDLQNVGAQTLTETERQSLYGRRF